MGLQTHLDLITQSTECVMQMSCIISGNRTGKKLQFRYWLDFTKQTWQLQRDDCQTIFDLG